MGTLNRRLYQVTVVSHYFIFVGLFGSLVTVPFLAPWYISLPIVVQIVRIVFSAMECPLSRLENVFRRNLGMTLSRGFMYDHIQIPLISFIRFINDEIKRHD